MGTDAESQVDARGTWGALFPLTLFSVQQIAHGVISQEWSQGWGRGCEKEGEKAWSGRGSGRGKATVLAGLAHRAHAGQWA